jgi:hypothetical protein
LRTLAATAAAGVLAAALIAPAVAVADGPECDHYTHCYGIANYNSGNIDAVGVDLWTDCLHLDTPLSDIATHEIWLKTNETSSSPRKWIEAGYLRGKAAGGDPEVFFHLFWAEGDDAAGTFYSHFVQFASVATWTNFTIRRLSGGSWGVYIDGTWRGTAVQKPVYGRYVQVGGETTEPQVYSHGKSKNLQWHTSAGWSWATPFNAAGTAGVYTATASGTTMEQTSLQNMCSPAPLTAKQSVKAPAMADVKKTALAMAAMHGEESPTGVEVVATTRKAAQRAVGAGDQLDSDQQVHLVQLRGDFVGRAPQGEKLPRGSVLTVTVDAKTGKVTDTSLTGERQDLAKLGSVKTL